MIFADEQDGGLDGRTTEMSALGRDTDLSSAVLRVSRRNDRAPRREPARGRDERPAEEPPAERPARNASLTEAERLQLRSVTFPTAWRGYDPEAVDAYVNRVGRILTQASSPPPSQHDAVREALQRVGERTTDILREAQQAAERMTAEAEREAAQRLERADREATQITTRAHARLREMDDDIERLWQERERLLADTRRIAGSLHELADEAQARFPAADEPDADRVRGRYPPQPPQPDGEAAPAESPAIEGGPQPLAAAEPGIEEQPLPTAAAEPVRAPESPAQQTSSS